MAGTVEELRAGIMEQAAAKVQRINRRERTARFRHTCNLCHHPIEPGQSYTRIFAKVDGRVSILKYHTARPAGQDECRFRKGRKRA
jgi:hypothetical protein